MKTLTIARATTLAKRHGIRVERLGSGLTPTWTGEAINVENLRRANSYTPRWPRWYPESRDRAARNLVHEVAHYLLAPPGRRKLPNFGLGADSFGVCVVATVPSKLAEREERLATLLGFAFTRELADTESALDYLRNCGGYAHGWPDVAELVRRGLLTEGGAPTAKAMGRP